MTVLRPSGELDVATVEPFRRDVLTVLEGDPEDLVIDLRDVSFLDSSGIAVVARALKTQRTRGRTLVLTNPQPIVRRALELVGLGELLDGR